MLEADDSLPRMLGTRYRLEAKLGSGGMGIVYRAADLTMHRPVAVKVVRGVDGAPLDEEVARRFLREAKNTARVQHEHIVDIYDLGRSEHGDMFFVMELLQGEALSAKLRREVQIDPGESVHITRQMCAALHVAHVAGVIHRDLKPANVMLIRRAGDDSFVKVLDFGVAKSYAADQETQLTHTGMLVGTVEYMAPEQIMGRKVDGRTDVYALGVVLYRMLSGQAPFRDVGVPALIRAHINTLPQSMTEIRRDIPRELDRVVLRCLAKDPERRYASMEELSRALANAADPSNVGLMSLEYSGDTGDDSDVTDKTEVARPFGGESFDDSTTTRLDRLEATVVAAAPRHQFDDAAERTQVMAREDSSGRHPQSRSISRDPPERDPAAAEECAMCRTLNASGAVACMACGISLSTNEQNAVRARVSAVPVEQSGPANANAFSSGDHPSVQVPLPMLPNTSSETRSLWRRLLAWTGLRER